MEKDFNTYIEESRRCIADVLGSFNVGHGEITATPGPTVTLFEFRPSVGVRLSKIRNLKDEFTVALGASAVRVIAPIPDNGTVGIEVPNKVRVNVPMNDMLSSEEYVSTKMELPLVMGRTVDNSVFMTDLAKMPHLLVAGATGMGKSVGLNVIIASLLNRLTPEEMKMVLIDPKQVELSVYEDIARPYLAHLEDLPPIITDPDDAARTLDAVIRLMESRYTVLKDAGVRNIQDYNASAKDKMPYYVVVIDEYGDLILSSNDRSMERSICRIAQKARAVGIHMIISTQRPDAKIVTGSIKANFPTRISFRTTTGTDSRVVLDRLGAERLTGMGDMLYFAGGDTTRVQCAYISTDEVVGMCRDIASKYDYCAPTFLPEYDECESEGSGRLFHEVLPATRDFARILPLWAYISRSYSRSPSFMQLQEMGIISYEETVNGFPVLVRDKDEINEILDNFYS